MFVNCILKVFPFVQLALRVLLARVLCSSHPQNFSFPASNDLEFALPLLRRARCTIFYPPPPLGMHLSVSLSTVLPPADLVSGLVSVHYLTSSPQRPLFRGMGAACNPDLDFSPLPGKNAYIRSIVLPRCVRFFCFNHSTSLLALVG